ncbi:unnamed protein product [Fraxinus pennsylvanica]|uniref:Endoglucanase n=1 Tax=Fraxinus pennsylvanica TaxID=56036 RepID=A0AAD2A2R0_9LAMI|nr:unnamed protein product [Fraxinus pennsylvanica]
MKFGFLLAFTATMRLWSILEYGDQMKAMSQLESVQDSFKWITVYLINAHHSANVIYIQVGSPKADHSCWDRPEDMTGPRPLTQVNTSTPGTEVLLSRVNFFRPKDVSNSKILQKYRKSAEAIMCGLLPESSTATSSRTNNGLIWVSEWNALQLPVASSFLAVLYSEYMLTSRTTKLSCDGDAFMPLDLWKFTISQADYILGNNPMDMSYLVGYGDKYPEFVHHRGAPIPADATTGCKGLESDEPNPNVATGALVGGPFFNDTYLDFRNKSMQGEPSTYNSALIVGLLSGLIWLPRHQWLGLSHKEKKAYQWTKILR